MVEFKEIENKMLVMPRSVWESVLQACPWPRPNIRFVVEEEDEDGSDYNYAGYIYRHNFRGKNSDKKLTELRGVIKVVINPPDVEIDFSCC